MHHFVLFKFKFTPAHYGVLVLHVQQGAGDPSLEIPGSVGLNHAAELSAGLKFQEPPSSRVDSILIGCYTYAVFTGGLSWLYPETLLVMPEN